MSNEYEMMRIIRNQNNVYWTRLLHCCDKPSLVRLALGGERNEEAKSILKLIATNDREISEILERLSK